MTIFLVVLAVVLAAGTAAAAWRLSPGRPGPRRPARTGWVLPGLAEPAPALPPILLPETPAAADVSGIRFGRALRGYRRDQVHEVLDRLAGALAERDAQIEDLRRSAAGCAGSGGEQQ
ncbi:DivIVA domain-containing protein [Arthrobacter sp. TMN-37]